jgi:hypothetical protein
VDVSLADQPTISDAAVDAYENGAALAGLLARSGGARGWPARQAEIRGGLVDAFPYLVPQALREAARIAQQCQKCHQPHQPHEATSTGSNGKPFVHQSWAHPNDGHAYLRPNLDQVIAAITARADELEAGRH